MKAWQTEAIALSEEMENAFRECRSLPQRKYARAAVLLKELARHDPATAPAAGTNELRDLLARHLYHALSDTARKGYVIDCLMSALAPYLATPAPLPFGIKSIDTLHDVEGKRVGWMINGEPFVSSAPQRSEDSELLDVIRAAEWIASPIGMAKDFRVHLRYSGAGQTIVCGKTMIEALQRGAQWLRAAIAKEGKA